MTDNELLLEDRLQKIQQVVEKYGEENFYVSFSGGKDSTVLSALVDMALPGNKIPRVYANTGIEYKLIVDFVKREKEKDHSWELVILVPTMPIKPMLEKEGYPFKSKKHSEFLAIYQRHKTLENRPGLLHYLHLSNDGVKWSSQHSCPQKLAFQFDPNYKLKISDKCCDKLKKEPLHKWQKESKRNIAIIGLVREEGGRRIGANCLAFSGKKLKAFQPLVLVPRKWEDWFIDSYSIDICEIYKEPYNFNRTGCKGCPFAVNLQYELDILEKFFPVERKQCEIIWKPVYDEYRRLGYRLKKVNSNYDIDMIGETE